MLYPGAMKSVESRPVRPARFWISTIDWLELEVDLVAADLRQTSAVEDRLHDMRFRGVERVPKRSFAVPRPDAGVPISMPRKVLGIAEQTGVDFEQFDLDPRAAIAGGLDLVLEIEVGGGDERNLWDRPVLTT